MQFSLAERMVWEMSKEAGNVSGRIFGQLHGHN